MHRDPWEWTGTSLCLEGSKIWRFLEPRDGVDYWDERLESYRLPSMAWGGTNDRDGDNMILLSAGWQSPHSLFQEATLPKGDFMMSAEELSQLPPDRAQAYLTKVASTTQYLKPNLPDDDDSNVSFTSVVQQTGELLLIPPYWYHQTYAPEPSLAVASQRCGSHRDARRVLQHILALQSPTVDVPLPQHLNKLLKNSDKDMPRSKVEIQTTIDSLFSSYLEARNAV